MRRVAPLLVSTLVGAFSGGCVTPARDSPMPVPVQGTVVGDGVASDGGLGVALEQLSSVSGVVRRGASDISGAKVELSEKCGSSLTTLSDESGHFEFRGIRPGYYEVQAQAGEGYGSETVMVRSETGAPEVLIQLGAARFIEVRLLTEQRLPISGVDVDLRTARFPLRHGVTADGGSVRLGPVPPGTYTIQLCSPDYVQVPSQRVRVSSEDARTEFTLVPAAPLQGLLVDAANKPVASANLWLRPWRERESPQDESQLELASSRKDGSFDIPHLAPGQYTLTVENENRVPYSTRVTVPARDVRIVLPPSVTVNGRVLDLREKPRAGIRLGFKGDGIGFGAETDDNGAFVLYALPGKYSIQASARLECPGGECSLTLPLKASEVSIASAPAQDVTLRLLRGVSIGGRVLDENERPVSEARVAVWYDGGLGLGAYSQDDGTFLIDFLDDGAHALVARKAGYVEARLESVEAEERNARLVLRAKGLVEGRVVDEMRRPIQEFDVDVLNVWPLRGESFQSDAGLFTLPTTNKTKIKVLFAAKGFASSVREFAVQADARNSIGEVVLGKGRNVDGLVTDGEGKPIAGAAVSLGEDRFPSATTSTEGLFTLPRVSSSEPTTVRVEDARYVRAELPLPVSTRCLSFRMTRGARIVGSFLGKDGMPLAGAAVEAYTARGHVRAVVDAKGSFEISALEPGPCILRTYVPVRDGNLPSVWRALRIGKGGEQRVALKDDAQGAEVTVEVEPVGSFAVLFLAPGSPRPPKNLDELLATGAELSGETRDQVALRPVPPGEYTLFAYQMVKSPQPERQGRIASKVITVDKRPFQRVKFVLPAAFHRQSGTPDED